MGASIEKINAGLRPFIFYCFRLAKQALHALQIKNALRGVDFSIGGERGIRTPGPFGSTVFKTAALDRSAISPAQK
jgi:hypothetical protein